MLFLLVDITSTVTIYVNIHTACENQNCAVYEIIVINGQYMEMISIFAMRYKQIGRKVAYYRRLRNLTQEALAKKINISTSYLSKIECGSYPKSVSLSVLMAIAVGLDIDLYLLFKFDERGSNWKEYL
jgi:DNA-binding XRE family transcriptional regulator